MLKHYEKLPKFHQKHEQGGYYCNSCSRLISEALTHGGYKTIDNRYICSLCYPDLVYQNHNIERVYKKYVKANHHIVRFHIGLEDPIDLIADLKQALRKIK